MPEECGMSGRHNIAAVVGGWSARHRVVAVAGWVVFVVVALMLGSWAGQRHMTEDQYAKGDSARAIQILDEAGLKPPAAEMFLVTGVGDTSTPALRAAVADLVARLQATGQVTDVVDPFANGLVSGDGRSVLVKVSL